MNLYQVDMNAWYDCPGEDDICIEHSLNVLASTFEEAVSKSKEYPEATIPLEGDNKSRKTSKSKKSNVVHLSRVEIIKVYQDVEIDIE